MFTCAAGVVVVWMGTFDANFCPQWYLAACCAATFWRFFVYDLFRYDHAANLHRHTALHISKPPQCQANYAVQKVHIHAAHHGNLDHRADSSVCYDIFMLGLADSSRVAVDAIQNRQPTHQRFCRTCQSIFIPDSRIKSCVY